MQQEQPKATLGLQILGALLFFVVIPCGLVLSLDTLFNLGIQLDLTTWGSAMFLVGVVLALVQHAAIEVAKKTVILQLTSIQSILVGALSGKE